MDLSLQSVDEVFEVSLRKDDPREDDLGATTQKKCAPCGWLRHWVQVGLIPGFGLFSESYLLFIFNQVGGPFKKNAPWTTCYDAQRDGYTKLASLVSLLLLPPSYRSRF